MAAALDDESLFGRLPNEPAEVKADNGAARARTDAVDAEGNGEDRPARVILQPRGEQADDARMPIIAAGDEDWRPSAAREFRVGLGACLFQHGMLHRLPLLVQPVKRLGYRSRLH